MFGTVAGGENPGPGRREKNWAQCLVDDVKVFRATEGSTESFPLVFRVETGLWPAAAMKSGRWYRGGEMFLGEVAQGQVGAQLATPRRRGPPE